jgi:Xaa-Pro aminopeptidase
MREHGLDGLVGLSRENVQYTSGYPPLFCGLTGGITLTPADDKQPPVLIVNDFELTRAKSEARRADVRGISARFEVDDLEAVIAGRTKPRSKPVHADAGLGIRAVADALDACGLTDARIGCELDRVSPGNREALDRLLPGVELVDGEPAFYEIRMVKHPAEVDYLREAVRLADVGLAAVLNGDVRTLSLAQLDLIYRTAIYEAVRHKRDIAGLTGMSQWLTSGGDVAPSAHASATTPKEGDTFYADYGAEVHGYASDAGRTFAVGSPHALTRQIMSALEAAHEATVPLLRPGTPMRDVYKTAQAEVRAGGLPTYTRGNMGHTAGLGDEQQPPYFSPGETCRLEAGMVVCFETPYYVRGLGGHQVEDMFLITRTGSERLTMRPRGLGII